MRRKRLGFAVAAGVAVVAAGIAIEKRGGRSFFVNAFRDKEKQVSQDVQKLVEAETDEVGSSHRTRSKARSEAGEGEVIQAIDVAHVDGATTPAADDHSCRALEYAGNGPDHLHVDGALWSQFMSDYHDIKQDLVSWLEKNSENFSQTQLTKMEEEIQSSRVMRPQALIEPDMTWRGVVAWTRPKQGVVAKDSRPALIHVSEGFLKLYQINRPRARFELTRALAQAWAPCELQADASNGPWNPLMGCLGLNQEQTQCSPGVVSEGSWAASTAVAALVSAPGCEIPAFQGDQSQACLKAFKTVGKPVAKTAERTVASEAEGSTR